MTDALRVPFFQRRQHVNHVLPRRRLGVPCLVALSSS
jgi:hypothetical protein